MNDDTFFRLATLYLEDAINAHDLELLNRELANSTDRVRQFNDLRLLTGLIKEHGHAGSSESITTMSLQSSQRNMAITSQKELLDLTSDAPSQPSRRSTRVSGM